MGDDSYFLDESKKKLLPKANRNCTRVQREVKKNLEWLRVLYSSYLLEMFLSGYENDIHGMYMYPLIQKIKNFYVLEILYHCSSSSWPEYVRNFIRERVHNSGIIIDNTFGLKIREGMMNVCTHVFPLVTPYEVILLLYCQFISHKRRNGSTTIELPKEVFDSEGNKTNERTFDFLRHGFFQKDKERDDFFSSNLQDVNPFREEDAISLKDYMNLICADDDCNDSVLYLRDMFDVMNTEVSDQSIAFKDVTSNDDNSAITIDNTNTQDISKKTTSHDKLHMELRKRKKKPLPEGFLPFSKSTHASSQKRRGEITKKGTNKLRKTSTTKTSQVSITTKSNVPLRDSQWDKTTLEEVWDNTFGGHDSTEGIKGSTEDMFQLMLRLLQKKDLQSEESSISDHEKALLTVLVHEFRNSACNKNLSKNGYKDIMKQRLMGDLAQEYIYLLDDCDSDTDISSSKKNILLLGMSLSEVTLPFEDDILKSVLHLANKEKKISLMDARDLYRILMTESNHNVICYTVSKEQSSHYSKKHLSMNFTDKRFISAVQKEFPNVVFHEVIFDWFWFPTSWFGDRVNTNMFFGKIIPGFARTNLLRGNINLPFNVSFLEGLAIHKELIETYYDVALLTSTSEKHSCLWKCTNEIEHNTMVQLGKDVGQENLYCCIKNESEISQRLNGKDIRPKHVIEYLNKLIREIVDESNVEKDSLSGGKKLNQDTTNIHISQIRIIQLRVKSTDIEVDESEKDIKIANK